MNKRKDLLDESVQDNYDVLERLSEVKREELIKKIINERKELFDKLSNT